MNNINRIGSYSQLQAIGNSPGKSPGSPEPPPSVERGEDKVEISQNAQFLSKIAMMPEIRMEKVEGIRQQIANGSYDSEEKLSAALDKMMEEYSF